MNMFHSNNISNSSISSLSEEPTTLSSVGHEFVIFSNNNPLQHHHHSTAAPPLPPLQLQKIKKKRSLPGNPDPDSEVIALSPKSLLATNRFICEICNKGFQRDQNLQLHRRGHNLPWKLKQRDSKEEVRKKVYVCPEPTCVHHHPSRALGDLTGIKKHFCRKHGEKKWKCGKCAKVYAVQSDWKAHTKTCGTREYKCDCGTIFSRKDSFITHRAFCDALAEESARMLLSNQGQGIVHAPPSSNPQNHPLLLSSSSSPPHFPFTSQNPNPNPNSTSMENPIHLSYQNPSNYIPTTIITNPLIHTYRQYYGELSQSLQNPTHPPSAHLSATALLQKAATARSIEPSQSRMAQLDMKEYDLGPWFVQKSDIQGQTRDFLGLNGSVDDGGNGSVAPAQVSVSMGELLNYTRGCTGSRNPSFDESDQVSVVKPLPINVGYGLAESTAIAASKIWG